MLRHFFRERVGDVLGHFLGVYGIEPDMGIHYPRGDGRHPRGHALPLHDLRHLHERRDRAPHGIRYRLLCSWLRLLHLRFQGWILIFYESFKTHPDIEENVPIGHFDHILLRWFEGVLIGSRGIDAFHFYIVPADFFREILQGIHGCIYL